VTRPLRIGIQLPEVEREVRWAEYVDLARTAEEVGFDSIWLGDHLLYRGDGRHERAPWEAFTLLSSLATVTERVAARGTAFDLSAFEALMTDFGLCTHICLCICAFC
jgi:alkanesulfonate monooxygenase SsuD/methylene tetrahydromethanopterin reductase-like flavin-dependent oxidoreductase (luciferase family)